MLQSVSELPRQGLRLNCIKVEFEAGAKLGEFSVTPLRGSEFVITADTIVPAIGQDPDVSGLRDLLGTDAALVRIDEQQRTSADGFFAGGDLVTMQRFVTVAFGFGKQAATGIDRYLRSTTPARDIPSGPEVSIDVINTNYYPKAVREVQQLTKVADRRASFDEVELGLAPGEALAESKRCFSCGTCTFCDNCFYYCPDIAISKLGNGYSVNGDYCKGCGLCVKECPTGSIVMRADA